MGRAWVWAAAALGLGSVGCGVRSAQADTPREPAEALAELGGVVGSGRGVCNRDEAWRARFHAAQKSTEEALRGAVRRTAHRETAAPDVAKLTWGARQVRTSGGGFAQAAWSADGHSHVFWFGEDGSPVGNVALPGSVSEPIADESGNLYAVGVGARGEGYILAATANASIRWAKKLGAVVGPELVPSTVFDGQLVLTDGRVFAIEDGAPLCGASLNGS
ncbi:MAG: hypothetical protein ACJ790_12025 [Myxococcaceae bacterium]